jgi:hypothetical protein
LASAVLVSANFFGMRTTPDFFWALRRRSGSFQYPNQFLECDPTPRAAVASLLRLAAFERDEAIYTLNMILSILYIASAFPLKIRLNKTPFA